MRKELEGTKTHDNIMSAFAGESQARNKYDYFASAARKEGFEQIAAIFEETALNEKEHAKRLAKFVSVVGATDENLKHASEGENYEWTSMYPEFERVAREEGFGDIADVFREIGEVEEHHERVSELSLPISKMALCSRRTTCQLEVSQLRAFT